MKTLLGLTLAASLMGGCAVVQIDENLEGLRGKYVVIYFTETTAEAQDFCSTQMNLPLSAACAMIANTKESREAAFKGFASSGDRIDCFVVVPTTNSLTMHELTRCATNAEGYWNTSRIGVKP